MHLYFIRHGQSLMNQSDWTGGHIDAGLTKLGQQQSKALTAWLPGWLSQIDVLYSSTLRRAIETSAGLEEAYRQKAILDDRIREYGNNYHDHQPWPNDNLPQDFAEIHHSIQPFAPITTTGKRDESWMHFRIRVGGFIVKNWLKNIQNKL